MYRSRTSNVSSKSVFKTVTSKVDRIDWFFLLSCHRPITEQAVDQCFKSLSLQHLWGSYIDIADRSYIWTVISRWWNLLALYRAILCLISRTTVTSSRIQRGRHLLSRTQLVRFLKHSKRNLGLTSRLCSRWDRV